MREIFNGRVNECSTRIMYWGYEDKEREESSISIRFYSDEYEDDSYEYITIRSDRYKGLDNLVGKPVRIILEVDE